MNFFMRSLALAHRLKPSTQFQFYPIKSKTAPRLMPTVQPTFLYLPSPELLQAMQANYQLQSTCPPFLWQVKESGG
ncbi:MAG: hypothetical protein HC805_05170 [Alkalinema sp. RL_2_19]|nr:hypothetical protein [Alkalinema sp. RL_2_19]